MRNALSGTRSVDRARIRRGVDRERRIWDRLVEAHVRCLGMSSDPVPVTDHFGQTTMLRFSKLERNPKVNPAEFRFQPPKGADVLGEK